MREWRRHPESGNALVEFILVGIGLLFALFSIFEICRGVWIYTTLAHAVKAGTRYAVAHGRGCVTLPNACASSTLTVAAVAQQIRNGSLPLDPAYVCISSMTSGTNTITETACSPDHCSVGGASGVCLSNFQSDTTHFFPVNSTTSPTSGNPGDLVTISAYYPFNTFISMFWPGKSGAVGPFGLFNLPAIGQQKVEF